MLPMTIADLTRYHDAAKKIETDGAEGYHTVCRLYGENVAGSLLVAFLRRRFNPEERYPPPDDIIEKTDAVLRDVGILKG